MKKFLAIVALLLAMVMLLSSCGEKDDDETSSSSSSVSTENKNPGQANANPNGGKASGPIAKVTAGTDSTADDLLSGLIGNTTNESVVPPTSGTGSSADNLLSGLIGNTTNESVANPISQAQGGIEGTWRLTDVRTDGVGAEEISMIKTAIQTGMINMTITFANGRFTSTTSGMGTEETTTGAYSISGNQFIMTPDGQTEAASPEEFSVNGNTLELSDSGVVMIFARQ